MRCSQGGQQEERKRKRGIGFIFPSRNGNRIGGLAKYKRKLDRDSGVTGWVLHDLRRTARSLMSRSGVRSDIAERIMGHAISGIEGVYDRHEYKSEKAYALRALAGLIENILRPVSANVRKLHG